MRVRECPVAVPESLMLPGKVPKPEPAFAPAPGASKMAMSEPALCAVKLTGIIGKTAKANEVKNPSVSS
jgi:hypothetical protein